uniref:Uncharacterized protein n=1 Tax=Ralstonia solanacearum TaxID=305 RepID=A0A0S4VUR7_RALSL|nr:protein of unknown function [Ralstonia solanacearum]CUV37070.1 protein of unknown function [Ralstonia solanacearum]CUV38311.1 protein of unknown function [Ralstonia solanacearum]CUV59989.1 protein of unknown function [Ralstonia solanacearum]
MWGNCGRALAILYGEPVLPNSFLAV